MLMCRYAACRYYERRTLIISAPVCDSVAAGEMRLRTASGRRQRPCAVPATGRAHQAAQDARDAVQVVHAAGVAEADEALQQRRQEREADDRDHARCHADKQCPCKIRQQCIGLLQFGCACLLPFQPQCKAPTARKPIASLSGCQGHMGGKSRWRNRSPPGVMYKLAAAPIATPPAKLEFCA